VLAVPFKFNAGVLMLVVPAPVAVIPLAMVTLPVLPLFKVNDPALLILPLAVIVLAAGAVVAEIAPEELVNAPKVKLPPKVESVIEDPLPVTVPVIVLSLTLTAPLPPLNVIVPAPPLAEIAPFPSVVIVMAPAVVPLNDTLPTVEVMAEPAPAATVNVLLAPLL
jgi:hypothetical protein